MWLMLRTPCQSAQLRNNVARFVNVQHKLGLGNLGIELRSGLDTKFTNFARVNSKLRRLTNVRSQW